MKTGWIGLIALMLLPAVTAAAQTERLTFEQYASRINETLGEGVTKENNAAIAIVLSADPDRWDDPALHAKLLEAMGLDAADVRPLRIPDKVLGEFAQVVSRGELGGDVHAPVLSRWLADHRKQVDAIRDAMFLERAYLPVVISDEYPAYDAIVAHVPLDFHLLTLDQLLLARARLRIEDGQLDEAMRDLIAAERLARHATHFPFGMSRLIAFVTTLRTMEAYPHLLTHPDFDVAAARRLQAMRAKLPTRRPLTNAMKLEESEYLDLLFEDFAAGRKAMRPELENFDLFGINVAYRAIDAALEAGAEVSAIRDELTSQQETYHQIIKAPSLDERLKLAEAADAIGEQARKRLPQRLDEFEKTIASLRDQAKRQALSNGLLEEAVTGLSGFMLPNSLLVEAQTEGTNLVIDSAIALTAYRLEHDDFPAGLADLVPDHLDEERTDPMDNQPLRYRVLDHEVLVYSVGRNRVDDGGLSANDDLPWQDITIRLPRLDRGDKTDD